MSKISQGYEFISLTPSSFLLISLVPGKGSPPSNTLSLTFSAAVAFTLFCPLRSCSRSVYAPLFFPF
jgi:hypothetical protein